MSFKDIKIRLKHIQEFRSPNPHIDEGWNAEGLYLASPYLWKTQDISVLVRMIEILGQEVADFENTTDLRRAYGYKDKQTPEKVIEETFQFAKEELSK